MALLQVRKVRVTFPEALARQLGVATPPLPTVEERKKRALQAAEVCSLRVVTAALTGNAFYLSAECKGSWL